METTAPQLFETLEDRRLYSVADFTIDPAASRISASGTIGNTPIMEQSAGSLTAWLTGTIKADVGAQGIRFVGGSTITPVEQYYFARPFRTTASLAGKVQNVDVLGTPTDVFFAMRNGATFDVTSPALPVVNGSFASDQVATQATAGTLDYEAGPLLTGSVSLADYNIVAPSVVPSSLTSVRGQARLTLRVDFTIQRDVPGNGTATINAAGFVVAAAHRLGGVAGNVYHDVNDNDLRDDGAAPLAGGFTVYADLDKNGRFDAGEPSAVTDARGDYQIEYVPYGDQTIRLQAPFGYRHSLPSTGRLEVNVIGNGNRTGQDFMVTRKSMVSGVARADDDHDGLIDSTETRWSGRRVFSDVDNNGAYTAGEPATTTNFKGAYTLRNLGFGTQRIRVELPKGNYVATPAAGYATVNTFSAVAVTNVNLGSWLGISPVVLPEVKLLLQ